MKTIKLAVLVISVLITNALTSQNKKILDEKNGFRELKFGVSIDSVSNLNLVEDAGLDKYYEKTNDKLTIGDFVVKSIHYGFYKGRLDLVIIKTVGYTNSKGVLAVFENQYGSGYKSNQYIEKYYWFGKTVTLTYDENSINNNATIFMSSKMFAELRKADEQAATNKAKNDL